MGFITNLINLTKSPDEVRAFRREQNDRIIDQYVQDNKQEIDNLRRKLEASRDRATSQAPAPAKYSFISWPETTQSGSSTTGDLGPPSRTKKIVFQVALDIQHSFPSEVTRYPVEMNSDISDHIIVHNSLFSVSAVFSDANSQLIDKEQVTGPTIQIDVYNELMSLRANKTIVSLSTPLDLYDDLVITNISAPKNIDVGRAFQVDIEFEQIRRVSLAVVKNVQRAKGPQVDKTCAPKTDEGSKPVENELPSTGSVFYTPETKKFIDDKWKELTGVTGP